ncbi:Glycoside Hydrolase Family 78 protein [Penicillium ucsense]|uniref:Glycoside Hydrolase Family 78 protein n=1 Tax=Penicillium ucsense TaxID=2839758 RepID=A0A8J8W8Y0_9EURO|nr:Glycoside Hydrolase Family 78 protein [Penicillium ucsense]
MRTSAYLAIWLTLGACALGSSQSDLPWPAIPKPQQSKSASEPVNVYPVSVKFGISSDAADNTTASSLTFSKIGDTFTLDYGIAVAGQPLFHVETAEGNPQIEVKYTEAFPGLLNPQSDGPFAFTNALAATFRVETYEIKKAGDLTGYFIQGSQRWQSIKMISGKKLVIKQAGFVSSVDQSSLDTFPGYFASSNSTYTDIWALGPRTQQMNCYTPGSQHSTWDITSKGAYIRGQKPASSTRAINLKNYTLSFETMIDRGGTGWRLDTEIDAIQATGPIFILTSEYPAGSFANIDRTLLPPNTLVLGRGWSLQNQTSLPGFVLDKFPLKMNVTEKEWHTILTESPGDGTYTVYLNDQQIAHFNISTYGLGDPNPYKPGGVYKGFAFGPWQDQAAWVRNVNVTLKTGVHVYSNPMTSPDVPVEYGVHANGQYTCSDAGKRDRYSWLGDRIVSSQVVMVGTSQGEFVWGPANEAFSRQIASGEVPCNTLFSPLDAEGSVIRTTNVDPLLVDYNFDFMQVIYDYWLRSGNDTFLERVWPRMVMSTSWAMSRTLDEETQLYGAPQGKRGIPISGEKGQALGPAQTVSMILALERMAEMANHLGDHAAADFYKVQAKLSRTAIDTLLWNATAGYYASTIGATGYDMIDIAQVLLADIGSKQHQAQFTDKLSTLRVPAGYINGTRYMDTPGIVNPYYESFLLQGLAVTKRTQLAQDLLDATWGPMVERDRNYTGGYWEYISTDGRYPGLDLFTGQTHFWGSYPTVFLSEYTLGVRPTQPGYEQFIFAPLPGFKTEWVHGRVPTPAGLIYAAWGYNRQGKIVMEITAPKNLHGTIVPPFAGQYTVGKERGRSGNYTFTGGERLILRED